MLLDGTNPVSAANQHFSVCGPANQTCTQLGLQVALDQSNMESAVMQGSLAVSGLTWAAQYTSWLLIKLTPKGIVSSFLSFLSFLSI